MPVKILYFTATGNCLAVAKRFDAECLSIPQLIREKQYIIEDESVGIVYPVYGSAVPHIVQEYLKKCTIRADYVFVIATYGNLAGGTLSVIKRILTANGNRVDYLTTLLMVDNYLPFFEMRNQVSRLDEKRTEENLSRIVQEVTERKKKDIHTLAAAKLFSSAANAVEGGVARLTAKTMFRVSKDCIACGVCVRVCPTGNVSQKGQSAPKFGSRCESCFACVHNCPKGAIHLRVERSGARFRNPETSLQEIIEANEQK